MNIIKCPKCESTDLFIYDTKGCIEDGEIIEETECLCCDFTFTVKAQLSKIEIEIGIKIGD
jgi:transcriptional regulator NrdR family protein